MATMTISLPDTMKDWIEARIREGDYASASDYVRDLVRRDKQRSAPADLTLDDLRRIVTEARAGGNGNRPIEEILAEGVRITKAAGTYRD